MSNRPPISWRDALRNLKTDRAERQDVREERLRSTAGLRGSPALALSAWRGRSGRRYVVGVHDLDMGELPGPSVMLAVTRDENGHAAIIERRNERGDHMGLARWLERVEARGATELHVHRLADSADERRAIVDDLRDEPSTIADNHPADGVVRADEGV